MRELLGLFGLRLESFSHIKFEEELRKLFLLITVKDHKGEIKLKSRDNIREYILQKRIRQQAKNDNIEIEELPNIQVRPYSYMQGRPRDSLPHTLAVNREQVLRH